jgi:hypothetical protein
MKKLSENLDNYDEKTIKEYALRQIKQINRGITYYMSDAGKAKYREGAKRYYWKHREKCLERAKEYHRKNLLAIGKVPQKRRGRPKKII